MIKFLLPLAVAITAFSASAALGAPADFDPGFGQNGRLELDHVVVRALAVQPDGKILVAREAAAVGAVYRLNPGGSVDQSFGPGGARRVDVGDGPHGLALQPDGKILVAGDTARDGVVQRLDAGGSPDESFGQSGSFTIDNDGYERAYALALQPDGKILVAGRTTDVTGNTDAVVWRLEPGGSLDDGFGQGGTARIDTGGRAYALALQPDGSILAAGPKTVDDDTDAIVYRLDHNGVLDPTFGQGGKLAVDDGGGDGDAVALVRQPDGKNVVAGTDGANAVVHRLNANGMLDPAFGQSGRVVLDGGGPSIAYTAALQADGKILVAGAGMVGDTTDAVIYRLDRDGSLDRGFDGDGALRIDDGGGGTAEALAVEHDGKILVGGLTDSGLTQTAVVYRLQGGDPAPQAQGSTQPGAVASPRRAPVLGLRISPSAFRAAGRGASALPAARSGGALVSFTLDRAADVSFVVERAAGGRRVGGRCVKPTRSNRGRRPCTRYTKLAGAFARQGVAGANRFGFTGRLSGRRLRPASYRLVATPGADGQRGAAKRARFRIKG